MLIIAALRRLRQEDYCELEAIMGFIVSSSLETHVDATAVVPASVSLYVPTQEVGGGEETLQKLLGQFTWLL